MISLSPLLFLYLNVYLCNRKFGLIENNDLTMIFRIIYILSLLLFLPALASGKIGSSDYHINLVNVPELYQPLNGSADVTIRPEFSWIKEDGVVYHLQVSEFEDFSELNLEIENLEESLITPETVLEHDKTYYWHVRSSDGTEYSEWSDTWSFHTIKAIPEPPQLIYPENGANEIPKEFAFRFKPVDNAESYILYVSTNEEDFESLSDSLKVSALGHLDSIEGIKTYSEKTEYFWAMKAVNSAGFSKLSEIWSFTTQEAVTIIYESRNDLIELSIFPNPASDYIYISKLGMNEISAYNIFSFDGRNLSEFVPGINNPGQIILDLRNIPSGKYFINIYIDNSMITRGFVIQR